MITANPALQAAKIASRTSWMARTSTPRKGLWATAKRGVCFQLASQSRASVGCRPKGWKQGRRSRRHERETFLKRRIFPDRSPRGETTDHANMRVARGNARACCREWSVAKPARRDGDPERQAIGPSAHQTVPLFSSRGPRVRRARFVRFFSDHASDADDLPCANQCRSMFDRPDSDL